MKNESLAAHTASPSGILLLDKPGGITSAKLITKVKKQLKLRKEKLGHTGTLDPLATGLLPLLLGEATKFAQFLLKADKAYIVTGQLGQKTNTADSDGHITETAAVPIDWHAQLPEIISQFTGKIMQVPPAFSALKQNGVPLYRLAREGKAVQVDAREIMIFDIVILKLDQDHSQFQLKVSCGPGTYIRSLVEDLGQVMGTFAHVIQLRREKTGPFSIQDAILLENVIALDEVKLLPLDSLVMHLRALNLDATCCQRLQYGQRVPYEATNGSYRFYNEQLQFLGILEAIDGVLHPMRLISTD